jgi:hypothetical protein
MLETEYKQMLTIRKSQLLIPLLAMTAVVSAPAATHASTAGDISTLQVLNTSPLWADAQSYHACNVVNVTTAAIGITVEMIESNGAVLASSATFSLAAGNSYELAVAPSYIGFARCRVSFYNAVGTIRANLTIFHPLGGGVYQTYATSEAR